MDDSEILGLIQAGWLKMVNGAVYSYHWAHGKYRRLTPTRHPKSGRYRYQLRRGDRQRTIGRNRLHWMFAHKQIIPAGFDIDHIDHDNTNDSIGNLRLRSGPENWSDNYSQANFADAMNFFDSVGVKTNGDF